MALLRLIPAFLVLISTVASAAPAPVNRVSLLWDPNTDFALRLKLIQDAKRTVDLVVDQHMADTEIGLPLLLAMRDAAKRGVKVRVLTTYFASLFSHSTRALQLILDDDSLATRPEMLLNGEWFRTVIPNPDANMWNCYDEKLLIADGEKAVMGGRNVGNDYLHYQDKSLYLEGPVVAEMQARFMDPTWKIADRLYGNRGKDPAPDNVRKHESFGPFRISKSLAEGMPEAVKLEANPEYTPEKVDILWNDLIGRMVATPGVRLPRPLSDPILENFLELARHSRRAYFYSLYPALDPRMITGLAEAVRNGSNVGLITNSLQSSRKLSAFTFPYDGSIESMLGLAEAGVSVYQWVPDSDIEFMHQKLAVVDDTVIFGSHNFNWTGTHGNDELDVMVKDPALADRLAREFEELAAKRTRKVSAEFLRKQAHRRAFGIDFAKPFLGLY